MLTLKLRLRVGKLGIQALYHIYLVLRKLYRSALGNVIQEQKQVDKRNFIFAHVALHLVVVGVARGVVDEKRARARVVKPGKLGKLADGELIAEAVAVHDLNGGYAENRGDVVKLRYLVEHLRLRLIIARRYDERHHVIVPECVYDLLMRLLRFVQAQGIIVAVVIRKRAHARKEERSRRDTDENRRHELVRFPRKAPDGVYVRHEAAVLCFFYRAAEHEQQPRHEQEHRQHRDQYGFYQHLAEVAAEAELHERHRDKAADGRQRGRGYLGYRLRQRLHRRVIRLKIPPLLGKAVAQDDGVVDCQGKLQNERYGVCDI